MKRTLNRQMITLLVITSLIIAVLFSTFQYRNFVDAQVRDMRRQLTFMENLIGREENTEEVISTFKNANATLRWSLIALDGEVLYETDADASQMDNHGDREEVKEALAGNWGEAVRESDTIGKETHYVAKQVGDDYVLRAAMESDNLWITYFKNLPLLLIIWVIAIILASILATRMTRSIMKPIDNITENLDEVMIHDEPVEIPIYEELSPLVTTLRKQSHTIHDYMRELKKEAATLKLITDNMNEGLAILDQNAQLILLNKGAFKALQVIPEDDYMGKDFILYCRDLDIRKKIRESLIKGVNHHHLLSNGYMIYMSPIWDEGNVQGLLLFIIDETEKIKSERLRREFTANVSHELKTPLTSILGYAELMKNGMANEENIYKFSDIILNESKRLVQMIDKLMELSELDEGKRKTEKTEVKLHDLGIYLQDLFKEELKRKNQTFKLEVSEDLIYHIEQEFVQEILVNLFSNAVKYTPEGGEITLSGRGWDDEFELSIIDNGIGMSQDDVERIFERFYVVDKSRKGRLNSTGLGLSIVKHLIENLNGQIEVESQENIGSKFTINIPAEKVKMD